MNGIVRTLLGGTNLYEKLFITEVVPDMVGLGVPEHRAVMTNRVPIQISQQQIFQYLAVDTFIYLVPHHCQNFFRPAVIIAIPVTPERTLEHIRPNIDRLILTIGSGNLYQHDGLSFIFHGIDMLIIENIRADLLRIVQGIPNVFHHLVWIGYTHHFQIKINFLHTEQGRTASGVCKRRVSLSGALRQTTCCFLYFKGYLLL